MSSFGVSPSAREHMPRIPYCITGCLTPYGVRLVAIHCTTSSQQMSSYHLRLLAAPRPLHNHSKTRMMHEVTEDA